MKDAAPSDAERQEAHRAMYRKLGRVFLWSGWAAAFVSLILGGHLVNRLSKEVLRLREENRRLAGNQAPPAADARSANP